MADSKCSSNRSKLYLIDRNGNQVNDLSFDLELAETEIQFQFLISEQKL